VSFRGTGASQTAVIWNGININSQLNGQTDFNTISVRNYDAIILRSGGGSVPYGSGAIGGSIHLNSNLKFKNHFSNSIAIGMGSFLTASSHYKGSYGTDRLNVSFGLEHHTSKNDHLYLGTNGKRNENGAFENLNLNLNLGYYLNKKNLLKIFQNNYIGERDFSGTIFAPSNDGYKDDHNRSMLQWHYTHNRFKSILSGAYLYERYRYFPNNQNASFSFGDANTSIVKYDAEYFFNDHLKLNAIVTNNTVSGHGTSIPASQRNSVATSILLQQQCSERLHYGVHLKQEWTENYEAPLVYAFDVAYDWSSYATLKVNASKNFRIPTYNDLYWLGQGNPDLNPETALQGEVVQELNYRDWSFSATAFYIKTKDLIQWKPGANGVWRPQNVNATVNQGVELRLGYAKQWKQKELRVQGDYGYTRAEDQDTKFQLLYVPLHKANASLAYRYRRLTGYYQFSWTDRVFLTADEAQFLPAYDVSNVGIKYALYSDKKSTYTMGFRVNNVYNESYQLVFSRPAPNRNFKIQFTFNF